MLIGAVSTLRRWIGGLVFPGIVLLMSQGFSLRTVALFLLAIIVFAALAALWGFLSWRATTYVVTGNSFRLNRGVFQKSERTIPLDHVQSVDTVQGVIQRAFGVYEVRIETAGGGRANPTPRSPRSTVPRHNRCGVRSKVPRGRGWSSQKVLRFSGGSRPGTC